MTFPMGHKGFRSAESYASQRGKSTWNKGTKGVMKPNQTSFCAGQTPWNKGLKNPYSEEQLAIMRENGRKRIASTETREKHRKNMMGNRRSWNGGCFVEKNGYIMKYVGDGNYVAEHRLIAENVLGRPLKSNECVHHVNGDTTDNKHSNLVICSRSYHAWLERRMGNLYKQEHFPRKQV